jgi:hypothetical protein
LHQIVDGNSFVVLNSIDDDVLVQTSRDLDINLACNEEDCKSIITALKAKERLRAAIAKASY